MGSAFARRTLSNPMPLPAYTTRMRAQTKRARTRAAMAARRAKRLALKAGGMPAALAAQRRRPLAPKREPPACFAGCPCGELQLIWLGMLHGAAPAAGAQLRPCMRGPLHMCCMHVTQPSCATRHCLCTRFPSAAFTSDLARIATALSAGAPQLDPALVSFLVYRITPLAIEQAPPDWQLAAMGRFIPAHLPVLPPDPPAAAASGDGGAAPLGLAVEPNAFQPRQYGTLYRLLHQHSQLLIQASKRGRSGRHEATA